MARITTFVTLLAIVSRAVAVPAEISGDVSSDLKLEARTKQREGASISFNELHGLKELQQRAAITALTAAKISSYTPYSYYASTAYCKPATTLAWNCGSNCNKNVGFKPIASGGDGAITQFWYVGYDPKLATIIVGHQGTDFGKIFPALQDANIAKVQLNKNMFPGVPSDVRVHEGFSIGHALAAPSILIAVRKGIIDYKATSVTTVGHSLGGALALLDGVYLPLHLPTTISFKTFTYGQPRVGNAAFASYVDSAASHVHLTRVTNQEDPVPILPGRFMGFSHPSGEVHIDDPSNVWYSCPGQDNTSELCSIGDATSIFDIDVDDHTGPYGVVTMGC